jgi:SAP domain
VIVDKYGRVAGSIDLATLAQMYAECDDDDLKAHYREVAAENGTDLEVPDEAPEPVEDVGEYDNLSKVELQEELADRGLATTGNKDELIARLEEDDNV